MLCSLWFNVTPSTGKLNDEELSAALKASVVENEVLNAQRSKEQADLEHAIAMSLKLEADRLRRLEVTDAVIVMLALGPFTLLLRRNWRRRSQRESSRKKCPRRSLSMAARRL